MARWNDPAAVGLLALIAAGVGHRVGVAEPTEARTLRVPEQHATIAAALQAAAAGDTVEVGDGVREEALRITRSVTLRAAPGATVRVGGAADGRAIEVEGADRVVVEGLRIEGGRSGVRVLRSREVSIRGNELKGFRGWGVAFVASSGSVVGNRVQGQAPAPGAEPAVGIGATEGSDVTFEGNVVEGVPGFGVWLDRGSDARLRGDHVRGSRRVGDRGGVGLVVRSSSRATLADVLLEDNEAGGLEVVGAELQSARSRVIGNGASGVRVVGGAEAALEDGEVVGTREGAGAGSGSGILVGGRSHLVLRRVLVARSAAAGLRAGEDAAARVEGATLRANAGGGLLVEGGASVALRASVLEGNGGWGLSVGAGTRADLRQVDVRGSSEGGITARDGAFLDLAGGLVEGNGARGIVLESGSRARVRRARIAHHAESGVAVLSEAEAGIYDCELEDDGPRSLHAEGARTAAGGNRLLGGGGLSGAVAPEALLAKEPSVTLRVAGDVPLAVTASLLREDGSEAVGLGRANQRAQVEPGRYRVAVQSVGADRALDWGTVEVTTEERVVHVASGIVARGGASGLRGAWRVLAPDGTPVLRVEAPTSAVALPPGRYLVVAAGRDDASTSRREAIVEEGGFATIELPEPEPCCGRPLVSVVATDGAAPGEGAVLVDGDAGRLQGRTARLRALGPDGRFRLLVPEGPADVVLRPRRVSVPSGGVPGTTLVLAEIVGEPGGPPALGAATQILLAQEPSLRLRLPSHATPEAPIAVGVLASGPASAPVDVFLSAQAGSERRWLVPGGRVPTAWVPDAARAPLRRRWLPPPDASPILLGPLPAGLAGAGEVRLSLEWRDPATGALLRRDERALRSEGGTFPLQGRLGPEGGGARVRARPLGGGAPHTVRAAADGSFSFEHLTPGRWLLRAHRMDDEGGLRRSEPRLVEVGAPGATDVALTLGSPVGAPPVPDAAGPAPAPTPPPPGPASGPDAPATSAAPAPEDACGPPAAGCPCGRLRVCVSSGSGVGFWQQDEQRWDKWWLLLPDDPIRKWRERKIYESQLLLESTLADELSARLPCVEALPMDTYAWEELLGLAEATVAEMERLADGANDPDPAEAERLRRTLQDRVDALGQEMAERLAREVLGCQATVLLGGRYRTLRGWEVHADLTFLGEREDLRGVDGRTPSIPGWRPGLVDSLVNALAPGIERIRDALTCDCLEVNVWSVTLRFPPEPFAPGAHSDFRQSFTVSCCGRRLAAWEVTGSVSGFRGVMGHEVRRTRRCCGQAGASDGRDAAGGELLAGCGGPTAWCDLDGDLLPNAEDPTPLGLDGR